ncbi:MAG: DUF932 domain-containing protein [Chitinophagaceae bacterium]
MNYTTHIPRFSSSANGAAFLRSRDGQPLAMEAVRHAAPSIFAEDKHSSRSSRYSYIPTSEILENLLKQDWQIFAAFQGGSRVEGKREFTKHLVRLRHRSQSSIVKGDSFNEVILMNSHDGTSSYRMMGGRFRLVCSNGLVVSESQIADVRVRHSGDPTAEVIDGCISIMEQMPELDAAVEEMQSLQLTNGEQELFARLALQARYGEDGVAPVTPQQVLRPRRTGDASNDLWTVFNRTQENIMRGGLRYTQADERGVIPRRQTREVRGIDANTNTNRLLWALAEGMADLKGR